MALKSCVTCPSYLTDDDSIRGRFGKAIGAPMCGRFGHVLGQPGHPNEEVVQHFAMKCPDHGKGMSGTPVSITPRVVKPDPDALTRGAPDEIGTCNGCENLVLQSDVMDRFGWPMPVCKAKGTLVLRPIPEAKGCPWARKGASGSHGDARDLELIDEFRPGFRVDDAVKLKSLIGSTELVEPSTYPSDAPVSSEDAACGIRAWRRYDDSETGNDYYLPIFDREYFTDEERARIPVTGQPFGKTGPPELYVDYNDILMRFLKDAYSLDETLCLTGAPGNGKSQFGIYLAWLMQVPFERFAIRPDLNIEDFVGHPSVDPAKGDYFVLGRFPRRWTRPGVIVSDEFNGGNDDVTFFYRSLFDTGKVNIDYEGGGLVLDKNDYLFHLVTMNPPWDMRNIGTRELADADARRLSYKWVAEPPEAVMRHILKEWCKRDDYEIPEDVLGKIISIGLDIRELSAQGTFPNSWGLAQEIKVARKTAHYASLEQAYRSAALDALEPEVANLVIQAISDKG